MKSPEDRFVKYLEEADAAGLKRQLREIHPISARECMVEGVDKACLDFSSNNYLGIADHPRLKEDAVRWTTVFGTGSKASRLVSGTFPEYIDLERRIAEWKGTEDALIIGSGYMANTGIIPAVAERKSAIFADKLNHASLNAGCILSGAQFLRYAHSDLEELGKKVELFNEKGLAKSSGDSYGSTSDSASKKAELLIVSDTVFSMDGDVADVEGLADIAKKSGALLYLDDAHATGLFGEKGEGLAHGGNANLAMGTFSKAMGCYGAYVACSKSLKEYLVNRCGSFVYTTALPPGVYGSISAAVDLVQTKEFCEIRRKLLKRSANLAAEIRRLGFDTGRRSSVNKSVAKIANQAKDAERNVLEKKAFGVGTATPIIPVIVGDTEETLRISKSLLKKNIFAVAIRPPTVPRNSARIRLSLNAAHTEEDIERLLEALKKAK